ncbi:MAG: M23 family metallopeptidase [Parvularculaceae bacterium]
MHFIFRIIGSTLLRLMAPAIFLGVGWYAGAKYGAPDLIIRAVDGVVNRAKAVLSPVVSEGARRSGELAAEAVQQGSDYVVGTVEDMLEDLAEEPDAEEEEDKKEAADAGEKTAETEQEDTGAVQEAAGETTSPSTPAVETETAAAEGGIVLCKMRISNPPRGGKPEQSIGRADETVNYKGVDLLLMPATEACLSSGFGYRNGKLHKGVDYYTDEGGDVLAGGGGVIVEAVTRSDYGNMIVVDHGEGVYTRYAHLARFGRGVSEGASVGQGQVLGPIGQTGASSIVHLHYEVLTGDFDTPAKSFGLEALDPFSL